MQVLAHLQENPRDTQRAIAGKLGVSLGSVNYCIKALISKGFLKVENFRKSSNKLGYTYLLTPSGIAKANLTIAFLKRKQREYAELERELPLCAPRSRNWNKKKIGKRNEYAFL